MESKESIQHLIVRLFAGEAIPEEKIEIQEWLNLSSENRKLFSELKDVWLAAGIDSNADGYHTDKALQQFRKKIAAENQKKLRRRRIGEFLTYAAIVLLLIGLPLSWYAGRKAAKERDSYTTITSAAGDKTSMVLPDSTHVWLNSGSKLTFNNNFRKGSRDVFLEGEAFFSVIRDEENPFFVRTAFCEVEVLGTRFNVKDYPNEEKMTTTVVEGSVRISSSRQQAVVKPRQKLVFHKPRKEMKIYKLEDTRPETEWKDGRLVFRNESLEDLKLKLERWFDVDILFADEEVKKERFTGILERESILEAVSYFGYSRKVGYRIEGNKITFYTKQSEN